MNRCAVIVLSSIALIAGGLRVSAMQAAAPTSVLQGVYTAAQAEQGGKQFQLACVSCHSIGEHTGASFAAKWTTLADLFDVMSNTMPQTDPGGLKAEDYTNIIAFFLKTTGYPEGASPLPSTTQGLKLIRVEPPPTK